MQIDWFTVLAQIVNFVILLVLLKYFLYDKVIDALKKREEKISNRLEEAEKKNSEAEEKREEYESMKKKIEEEKEATLKDAEEKAKEKKKEIEKEAKEKIEQKRKDWEKQLEDQKDELLEDVRRLISREAFSISAKALKEIADEDLENKIIEKFIDKLDDLEKDEVDEIKETLKEAEKEMNVKTGYELSDKSRSKLEDALGEKFYKTADYNYSIDENIICGIEVKVKNRKLNWNFNDFIKELDDEFQTVIEEKTTMSEKTEEKKNNG